MRTFQAQELVDASAPFREELEGFHPEDWIALHLNVALTDGNGNYALFERFSEFVVTGHYFFKARGKDAVKAAETLLAEAFTGPYNIETIRGITPLTKLGARWLSKHIGFKSYGTVQAKGIDCELFILNKKEWEII